MAVDFGVIDLTPDGDVVSYSPPIALVSVFRTLHDTARDVLVSTMEVIPNSTARAPIDVLRRTNERPGAQRSVLKAKRATDSVEIPKNTTIHVDIKDTDKMRIPFFQYSDKKKFLQLDNQGKSVQEVVQKSVKLENIANIKGASDRAGPITLEYDLVSDHPSVTFIDKVRARFSGFFTGPTLEDYHAVALHGFLQESINISVRQGLRSRVVSLPVGFEMIMPLHGGKIKFEGGTPVRWASLPVGYTEIPPPPPGTGGLPEPAPGAAETPLGQNPTAPVSSPLPFMPVAPTHPIVNAAAVAAPAAAAPAAAAPAPAAPAPAAPAPAAIVGNVDENLAELMEGLDVGAPPAAQGQVVAAEGEAPAAQGQVIAAEGEAVAQQAQSAEGEAVAQQAQAAEGEAVAQQAQAVEGEAVAAQGQVVAQQAQAAEGEAVAQQAQAAEGEAVAAEGEAVAQQAQAAEGEAVAQQAPVAAPAAPAAAFDSAPTYIGISELPSNIRIEIPVRGTRVITTRGDGWCFYRAVQKGKEADPSSDDRSASHESAIDLAKQVSDWLKRNKDSYATLFNHNFGEGRSSMINVEGTPRHMNFDEYTDLLPQEHTEMPGLPKIWPEIDLGVGAAAANVVDSTIAVYRRSGSGRMYDLVGVYPAPSSSSVIHLVNANENHFDLIVPQELAEPAPPIPISEETIRIGTVNQTFKDDIIRTLSVFIGETSGSDQDVATEIVSRYKPLQDILQRVQEQFPNGEYILRLPKRDSPRKFTITPVAEGTPHEIIHLEYATPSVITYDFALIPPSVAPPPPPPVAVQRATESVIRRVDKPVVIAKDVPFRMEPNKEVMDYLRLMRKPIVVAKPSPFRMEPNEEMKAYFKLVSS